MERPISSKALDEVQTALFKGAKILAIKIYREDTGASLLDAKTAVERLEAEWRTTSPERFKAPAPKKGCRGVCLAFVIWFAVMTGILLLIMLRKS